MKRLFIFLLLISSIAKAQTDVSSKYTYYQYLYGNRTARLWADSILRAPGDTAHNAAQNSIAVKGGSFYVKGATKWDLITGTGGGGINKVDSVNLGYGVNTDTIKYYINGTAYTGGYLDKKDGLISGGVVTWSGSGLVFDVTAAVYRINGVRYTSSAGSITLSAADPSNPRIDVIGVDNTGTIIKVTGDAASNPIEPQVDPSSQIYLTSVQVNAGATTPNGVSSTTVYDENTEWSITPQGVTANGNNTTNIYNGSKSIDVSSWSNLQQIAFTNGSALNPASYATLKLFVKLKGNLSGASNITATFFNGSTAVTNEVNLTGYGLVRNSTSYQNISIPFTAFTFTNSFDKLRIRFTGTGSGCYLDYITVQSGVVTQPTVQGLQNAYAVITDGTNNATASGGDRFTFRTDNTLSKAVTNNDATYGDNILIKVDTSVLSTRAWRQKGIDSLAANIKQVAASNGTYLVSDTVRYGGSKTTATNANYTVGASDWMIELPVVTASRQVTLPPAAANPGRVINFLNKSTSPSLVWTFGAPIPIDVQGTNRPAINRRSYTTVYSDGTNWIKIGGVVAGSSVTPALTTLELLSGGNGLITTSGTSDDTWQFGYSLINTGAVSLVRTASFTAATSDEILRCDATGGAFAVTLPTAANASFPNKRYTIKKIDSSANAITIQTTSSQTLDGSTTYTLNSQWKYVTVVSDQSNWIIIGGN